MTRVYCTYFDHRYAARGLAMIRSLRRQDPDALVWVLCLDSEAEDIFKKQPEKGAKVISLSEFEAADVSLQTAKADGRSLVEYYFTCTASLVRYVMQRSERAEYVTYLDGDLWFFSSPSPIYTEAREASVIIVPHRFPPAKQYRNIYGIYNVGWVSFRRTADGLACLDWWRQRSLEWCRDVVDEENDRFADQRYLDRFPKLFGGVHSLVQPGANLAPWNIAGHRVSLDAGEIKVDGEPLIFFHFHGLKRWSKSRYLTSHGAYGAALSEIVRRSIYRPYLEEVHAIERELGAFLPQSAKGSLRHGAGRSPVKRFLRETRGHVLAIYSIVRGLTIRTNR